MSEHYPITQAVRFLRQEGIEIKPFLYEYVDHGGTAVAAQELSLEESAVVKTIVLEDESRKPLIVLMHGDNEVSTKQLARLLNVKSITPCKPEVVTKHTGYIVGGTSPFGTKLKLPVYMQETIFLHEEIYINGGKRGFLVGVSPEDTQRLLGATLVEVAV